MYTARRTALWLSAVIALLTGVLVAAPTAQAEQPSYPCDPNAAETPHSYLDREPAGEIRVGVPGEPWRATFSEPNWQIESGSDVDYLQFEMTTQDVDGLARLEVVDEQGNQLPFEVRTQTVIVRYGMPSDHVEVGDQPVLLTVKGFNGQASSGCYRVNVFTEGLPLKDITEVEHDWVPSWTETPEGVSGPLECASPGACTGSGVFTTRIPLSLQPWDDLDNVVVDIPNFDGVFDEFRHADGDCGTYLAADPFSPTGESRYSVAGLMKVSVHGGVNSRSSDPADLESIPVSGNVEVFLPDSGRTSIDLAFDQENNATYQCPGNDQMQKVELEIGDPPPFGLSGHYYGFAMGGYWATITYELSYFKQSSTPQFEQDQIPCFDEFSIGGFGQFGDQIPNPNWSPNAGFCGELPPGFGPDDLPDFPEFPGLPGPGVPGPGPVINPGY